MGMELVAALARPARSASAARQSLRAQTGSRSAMHQQLGSRCTDSACCTDSASAAVAARQSLRAQTGSRSAAMRQRASRALRQAVARQCDSERAAALTLHQPQSLLGSRCALRQAVAPQRSGGSRHSGNGAGCCPRSTCALCISSPPSQRRQPLRQPLRSGGSRCSGNGAPGLPRAFDSAV